jgi:hypothetical protein
LSFSYLNYHVGYILTDPDGEKPHLLVKFILLQNVEGSLHPEYHGWGLPALAVM